MKKLTNIEKYYSGQLSVEDLNSMDEARDYDAASSYNWLYAELLRLRIAVEGGVEVEVYGEQEKIRSVEQFYSWAVSRYPLFSSSKSFDIMRYVDNEGVVGRGYKQQLKHHTPSVALVIACVFGVVIFITKIIHWVAQYLGGE